MKYKFLAIILVFPIFSFASTKLCIENGLLLLEHDTEELFFYQVFGSLDLSHWSEAGMPEFLGTGKLEKIGTLMPASAVDKGNLFFKIVRGRALAPFDPDNHPPIRTITYPPLYPIDLRREGIEGVVVVVFTISPEGSVQDIEIESSTDERFSEAVLFALQFWRFNPYTVDGERLEIRARQPIPFILH